MNQNHKLKFRRYGRNYQAIIKTAEDLGEAIKLDEAFWVAIGAPIDSFRADRVLLDLLDSDCDGRIRVFELKTAVQWTLAHLNNYSGLNNQLSSLQLDSIRKDQPDGLLIWGVLDKMISQRADQENSPQVNSPQVSLQQIRKLRLEVEQGVVSEAGVVLPEATEDPEIRQFMLDIIETMGGVKHTDSRNGINLELMQDFIDSIHSYLEWQKQALLVNETSPTSIMPFTGKTYSAYSIFIKLRSKIDDYFVLSQAVCLDDSIKDKFWPTIYSGQSKKLDNHLDLNELLKESPIAEPNPECKLNSKGIINPVYQQEIKELFESVIVLAFPGETSLSRVNWLELKTLLQSHQDWQETKKVSKVEMLDVERLEKYCEKRFKQQVESLILQSRVSAFDLEHVKLAEKLALFQANLISFANNFISFPDLYNPKRRAIFEEGTLIMDGRRFNFSIRVHNHKEHVAYTSMGSMFIMYVQIINKGSSKKMEIAVPVTSGTQGNIMVGKRGIFQHVDSSEWSAQVIDIIDQPISLREALWAPFQRIKKALRNKFQSMTTSAEQKMEKASQDAVTEIQTISDHQSSVSAGSSQMGSVLVGGGIAVAALGSSLAFITKTIAGLGWWEISMGLGGALLAVIIPTSIMAFSQLRSRDLSLLLEGSGWAINSRMRLTRKQRKYLTQTPKH